MPDRACRAEQHGRPRSGDLPDAHKLRLDRGGRKPPDGRTRLASVPGAKSRAPLELEIVFNTLGRRVPSQRLAAPAEDVPLTFDAETYTILRVPVTWDA